MTAGTVAWLPAQTRVGENAGTTETHGMFVGSDLPGA